MSVNVLTRADRFSSRENVYGHIFEFHFQRRQGSDPVMSRVSTGVPFRPGAGRSPGKEDEVARNLPTLPSGFDSRPAKALPGADFPAGSGLATAGDGPDREVISVSLKSVFLLAEASRRGCRGGQRESRARAATPTSRATRSRPPLPASATASTATQKPQETTRQTVEPPSLSRLPTISTQDSPDRMVSIGRPDDFTWSCIDFQSVGDHLSSGR